MFPKGIWKWLSNCC